LSRDLTDRALELVCDHGERDGRQYQNPRFDEEFEDLAGLRRLHLGLNDFITSIRQIDLALATASPAEL